MSPLGIVMGPCVVCGKAAHFKVGSRTCRSCGHSFERMCSACASKRCSECKKGELAKTEDVFPHSLFHAIKKGDENKISDLLVGRSEKVDDIKDRNGEILLSLVARLKPAEIAQRLCTKLIALGASPYAKSDKTGRTALIDMVVYRKFSKKVARLLDASINEQDNGGRTALMAAVQGAGLFGSDRGNVAIVKELLTLGADPFIRDKQGRTALQHSKHDEMKECLEKAMQKPK